MSMDYVKKILLNVVLVFSSSAIAGDKTVYMTSLDWPPYTGKELYSQGATIAVAKAAFETMSYTLIVEFYPWSRAVNLAKDRNSKYIGYLPEYYAIDLEENFIFSDVMGNGPLGLVENNEKPIRWTVLNDLQNYTVGVVQDYVNTTEFDQWVSEGRIKTQTVTSDLQNIKKVAAGRIDLAIIDKNVLDYLLESEPTLAGAKDKVHFNQHLLETKKLYACFKRTPEGESMAKLFNEGLAKIDIVKIMKKHTK